MKQRPGPGTWRLRDPSATGTSARRFKVAAVLLALSVAAPMILVAAPENTGALGIPGIIGFITNDGLFFVEYGYSTFGYPVYVYNGSQVYSAVVVVNITSVTLYNETAYIHLYSYWQGKIVANASVTIGGYGNQKVELQLPVNHDYTLYRLVVDGTPGWFYGATPYNFLTLTNLQDGGVDLGVFVSTGLFLVYGLTLMVKSERMTRRAIYCPRWKAVMWLHGIFFGLVAWYFASFPTINSFFKGWEFVVIPVPEALFLFFWNGGRHSTNRQALFIQMVPRMGQRMGTIVKFFFVGRDRDGDLVLIKERSVFQWWLRSRGHHVKAFRRSEKGVLEPVPFDVLEHRLVGPDQLRDPSRFPRGAKYDAHDDFPVINSDDEEDSPIERIFFVPRISSFKVVWPYVTIFREIEVPAYTDLEGKYHSATTKRKLAWPYVVDGKAEIQLASWHYGDVLAIASGWMQSEDLVEENDDLAIQVWTLKAKLQREASRKADERLSAEQEIQYRPYHDLSDEELEAGVPPRVERALERKRPREAGA